MEKAEKYFTEALYGEEVEPFAYYELAKISIKKGQKDRAVAYLNKALELEPALKEKLNEEQIFIPIKSYIVIPENKEETNRKQMGRKEEAIKKHLEETLEIVEKLNNRTDYFRKQKQKNKENKNIEHKSKEKS